jgi:hypothetical protein
MTAKPPITPPTMAPTFVLLPPDAARVVDEAAGLELVCDVEDEVIEDAADAS